MRGGKRSGREVGGAGEEVCEKRGEEEGGESRRRVEKRGGSKMR